MTCFITINFGTGSCEQGFESITVQLWRATQGERMQLTATLPPASELVEAYRQWQRLYLALQTAGGLRHSVDSPPIHLAAFEIDETDLTNIAPEDLVNQGQHLSAALNFWLSSPTFAPVEQQLRTHLQPSDVIQVIIQTTDSWLRHLPWHLWHFFEAYPAAEPALGLPHYRSSTTVPATRSKLRILAILGNSQGIDITQDQSLLNQLPQAEVVFLAEPSRAELDRWLWQDQGWDVLFFAGHSATTADGAHGNLAINPDRYLSIADLRHALNHAIRHGLTLAIFNSCDGLGLAHELADLNLPQLVVMREPVPDLVAQAFLKFWLQRFSQGIPLAQALRQARQQLQGWEDDFPGASWLPIMFQNPAIPTLHWPSSDTLLEAVDYSNQPAPTLSRQQLRNRQALLNRVNRDWIEGVLNNSLQGQVMISLGLEEQPGSLACPWNVDLETDTGQRQPLSDNTRIIDVYKRLGPGSTLLLLGEPGAGKTTTLLTLAQDLLISALGDVTQLIPVVLNLSTWISRKDDFMTWLVLELKTKYRVPSRISRQWIEDQELLLLLDGLDEINPAYRDSCIQNLNRFSQETGVDLVVCCRARDYADCRRPLTLNTTLYLRPLSPQQVNAALTAAGEPLRALRQMIETQSIWQELAQSPLMLNIMMLTYQGVTFADLPRADDIDSHRQRIFAAYLRRMFQRRRAAALYPANQVTRQLAWLAQRMQRSSQSVFLLETIQVNWLSNSRDRLTYEVTVRAVLWMLWGGLHLGLIAGHGSVKETFDGSDFVLWGSRGLISGLGYGALSGMAQHWLPGRWYQGLNSVLAAVVFGLLFSQVGQNITIESNFLKPEEAIDVGQATIGWGVGYGLIYAGISLLIDWKLSHPIQPMQALRWSPRKGLAASGLGAVVSLALIFGPKVGVPQSLVFGSMVIVAGGFDKRNTVDNQNTFPNQGMIQALKNAGSLFGLIGLATAMPMHFLEQWVSGVVNGFLFGVAVAMLVAGVTAAKHYALRVLVALQGHAPWRYRRFLDYAVQLIFLRRVGGGYIFIHRLLLEYLASHTQETR